MPEEHKPTLTDGIFQGKVIESLDNIKAFMVKVETAILNLQNTKADKSELTAYETKIYGVERELSKGISDSHKELEVYKDSVVLMLEQRDRDQDVKSEKLKLELDEKFTKMDIRLSPLETFKNVIIGGFSVNGFLTVVLSIIAVYNLLNK